MSATTGLRANARGGLRLLERNAMVYRRLWPVLVAGLLEPAVYLLGIGYGVGSLIGPVDTGDGPVSYAAFTAPAMVATAAMNGAVYDTTFSMLHKLRYERIYDVVLATPVRPAGVAMGEVYWALLRAFCYVGATVLLAAALGLVPPGRIAVVVAAAELVTFCFAGVGCAICTFLRSWQDTEIVNLVQMLLFLVSGTFVPVALYPAALRVPVELSPLTRGTGLLRELVAGTPSTGAVLIDVAYLVTLGVAGIAVTAVRVRRIVLV